MKLDEAFKVSESILRIDGHAEVPAGAWRRDHDRVDGCDVLVCAYHDSNNDFFLVYNRFLGEFLKKPASDEMYLVEEKDDWEPAI